MAPGALNRPAVPARIGGTDHEEPSGEGHLLATFCNSWTGFRAGSGLHVIRLDEKVMKDYVDTA